MALSARIWWPPGLPGAVPPTPKELNEQRKQYIHVRLPHGVREAALTRTKINNFNTTTLTNHITLT